MNYKKVWLKRKRNLYVKNVVISHRNIWVNVGCGQWNTLVEEMEPVVSSRRLNYANAIQTEVTKPRRLTEVETKSEARIETEFQEFNRVLGGGIVDGSLVLIGGDPGIGKSTLLLQISSQLADSSYDVLYISGEESAKQIKLRADRLHVKGSNLFVVAETDLQRIAAHIEEMNPNLLLLILFKRYIYLK